MDAKLLAWARRVKARGQRDRLHLVAGPPRFGTGPYDATVMAGRDPAIHVLGFGGRATVLSSGATGTCSGCDAWMAGSSPAMTILKEWRSAVATGHSTFRARMGVPVPPLWLFTDAARLPDPLPAIRHLPPGLAGVVLRHDHVPERWALARAVARLCRARRLALSVSGDWRFAASLGAGLHLRGGVPRGAAAWVPRLTGSAHDARQAARCRRAGVGVIFLSPVFATASHPGASVLGPLRWAALARRAGPGAAALGGIGGRKVARLPPACHAIGAIDALLA